MRDDAGKMKAYYRPVSPPACIPYCVRTAGWIRNQPYHSTLGTYNNDVMLTIHIAGRGVYRLGGSVVEVGADMVGLVLPSPDVGMLMADPEDPYEHFFCRFAGDEAFKTAARIVEEHGGHPFFEWKHWRDHLEVLRQLAVFSKNSVSGPDRTRQSDALCAYILACIDAPSVDKRRRVTGLSIERYMHTHLSEPVKLDRMAADFGVSKAYLCRSGRAFFGETLLRKWMRMKMDWAQRLLCDRTLPVGEAGMRVGFDDQFYFSRVFKAYTGKSPAQWRKDIKRQ